MPGTTNTIYSKEKIFNERTKGNTVPSLNTHLLSPLQNKKGEYIKITHMFASIITMAKIKDIGKQIMLQNSDPKRKKEIVPNTFSFYATTIRLH